MADGLLSGWRKRIRERRLPDKSRTVMDLLVTAKDDKLSAYYDHLRIRIRISRSSAFHFAVIAVVFPVFAATRHNGLAGAPSWTLATTVAIASAAVAGLALDTWVELTRGFYQKFVHGLEVVAHLRSAPAATGSFSSPNGDTSE